VGRFLILGVKKFFFGGLGEKKKIKRSVKEKKTTKNHK